MWSKRRRKLIYNSSLVGENMERFDLRGVDLRGANFTNTNLRQADLRYADLRYCKFIKADLSQANLHMADFSHADMTDCDLTMSYGRVTNFYRTRMWAAKIRRVTYKGALFIETDHRAPPTS